MIKKILLITFVLVAVMGIDAAAQCAMCRATVETNLSEGRGAFGTGINFGILYLLSAPYLLIGGLILLWYRVGKKELKARTDLENQMSDIYNKK